MSTAPKLSEPSKSAWEKLQAGNKRFVADQCIHPNSTSSRRLTTAREGQNPFAVVLACSDSRVPPELIFDSGIGDLFVVRVAGNVIDKIVLGSIEYAVKHLESPLIIVLGHSQCGAVIGACGGNLQGQKKHLEIALKPAIKAVDSDCEDLVDAVIRENTRLMALHIRAAEPFIRPACEVGQTHVIPAYYDLNSGIVSVLD